MRIIDCEQGTPEWFAARIGVPSASKFSNIITTKGERSKSREKYMYQLAGETLSGMKADSYQSKSMEAGIAKESGARTLFEMIYDTEVLQVGFCVIDEPRCGCSPDGLVGESSGIEIKCPEMATHIQYLLENRLPPDYFQQVQGSMFVTGRPHWYFMSFFPNIKPLILKVERDEAFISKLAAELAVFNKELDVLLKKLS